MRIVLATRNPGKVRELEVLLAGAGVEIAGLRDFPQVGPIEETGLTFEENAVAKALAVARATGLPALADDSGIEVEGLEGRPGVFSARYAGEGASDAENRAWLLAELRERPAASREARFRCVIALATPDGRVETAEGVCEGEIAFEERGTDGFGYDPIFLVPGTTRTMAEHTPEEKNRASHRARAVAGIRRALGGLAREGPRTAPRDGAGRAEATATATATAAEEEEEDGRGEASR